MTTQSLVRATLRLLRDDETIDKDLLAYADRALSAQFNRLLKDAVPRVEKADRSVGEMLSVTDDPLLIAAKGRRYLVKFSDITMPFEDLRYWALESGYALSTSDSRSSTFVSKEEGSRYRIKCPKCDEQAIRLIQGNGELVAIAREAQGGLDSSIPLTPRRHTCEETPGPPTSAS